MIITIINKSDITIDNCYAIMLNGYYLEDRGSYYELIKEVKE